MLKWLLCLVLIAPTFAAAQVRYSEADLQRVRDRSIPSIQKVFVQDIIGNMPRADRARAAQIRLAFPVAGDGPLSFFAEPGTQTISMPLTSIRFMDDMSTLFAWFESKGCQPEYLQSYLWALLREGRPLPSPLVAFAVDRDVAFADTYTYELSGKIVSSAIQFILAHEVGHLMLDHRLDVDAAGSQRQETEADRYALEHFARLGGSPMGVFWYYLAAWWLDPVSSGRGASSHPVSPERITALGDRLLANPMDFAHAEADPAKEAEIVRQLGGMVKGLADMIDDDGMLTLMPLTLERDFPPSRYATACPS